MKQPILLLDNFDSFTYNLYHLLYTVSGTKPVVMRNDLPDPQVVLEFDRVVLSPGPGLPQEAGKLMDVIDLC
jgi:anthranilate synthase component 2